MSMRFASALGAIVLSVGTVTVGLPARGAPASVDAGVLTCNVDGGWGFVFGSSHNLNCTYSAKPGVAERYRGTISKFGVDIGYLQNAVIVWTVFAPTIDAAPGSLAGVYGGATGSATVGIGAGANVLIGGSNQSISLQPVSIQGLQGLNVAAGIASIKLQYQP